MATICMFTSLLLTFVLFMTNIRAQHADICLWGVDNDTLASASDKNGLYRYFGVYNDVDYYRLDRSTSGCSSDSYCYMYKSTENIWYISGNPPQNNDNTSIYGWCTGQILSPSTCNTSWIIGNQPQPRAFIHPDTYPEYSCAAITKHGGWAKYTWWFNPLTFQWICSMETDSSGNIWDVLPDERGVCLESLSQATTTFNVLNTVSSGRILERTNGFHGPFLGQHPEAILSGSDGKTFTFSCGGAEFTKRPTTLLTSFPTFTTSEPVPNPTVYPTTNPTVFPSHNPTVYPTTNPTVFPSHNPTVYPTTNPTVFPSHNPSSAPSKAPSQSLSNAPSNTPSSAPSFAPSSAPFRSPSFGPTHAPSFSPSKSPTSSPSTNPANFPANHPSTAPSGIPSALPTLSPTAPSTNAPSSDASDNPTNHPSKIPYISSTISPTKALSFGPSASPTSPSNNPSRKLHFVCRYQDDKEFVIKYLSLVKYAQTMMESITQSMEAASVQPFYYDQTQNNPLAVWNRAGVSEFVICNVFNSVLDVDCPSYLYSLHDNKYISVGVFQITADEELTQYKHWLIGMFESNYFTVVFAQMFNENLNKQTMQSRRLPEYDSFNVITIQIIDPLNYSMSTSTTDNDDDDDGPFQHINIETVTIIVCVLIALIIIICILVAFVSIYMKRKKRMVPAIGNDNEMQRQKLKQEIEIDIVATDNKEQEY
eukprot:737479_1